MTDEFKDPSPQALAGRQLAFVRKYDFPFERVPVGKSFSVLPDQVKSLQVLRSIASAKGKKLGVYFAVVNHGDVYEVCNRGAKVLKEAEE